ncbi:MAG: hypothetical protein KC994_11715 [Candidatus Omnitrophica bacterium]|nr:hypothetical protein [Candidatus Omnitrophota bacterium]
MALATIALSIVITLTVAFLFLEITLRRFFPQPLGISYRSEMSIPVHTPNYTLHRKEPEFEITTTFNSLGLRDREYPIEKPAETERILVLGDSITAALQVADEEVYTEILEASLNRPESATHYEVINAGISGFGQGDELKMFEYVGKKLKPDIVLVQMSPINDLSENLYCRWYEIRDGKVHSLADIQPNWAVRLEEFLGRHSHFVQFLRGRLHAYFGDQGEHFQKIADHKRRYHDYLYANNGNKEDFAKDWDVTFAYLDELEERVEEGGAKFGVAIRPLDPDVQGIREDPYPRDLIIEHCQKHGVPWLDLTQPFRERAEGDLYRLRFRGDSHWRPEGHEWAAEEILQFLGHRFNIRPLEK